VAAALNTALLRAIVWREVELAGSPRDILARLNEQLCRDLPEEHFASAVFGWFDFTAGRLQYANADHSGGINAEGSRCGSRLLRSPPKRTTRSSLRR
jgi:serine phosphatase RsbU (regulator of sigma subunit)